MSDYIVSARKYRPESFDTVVGQESVTSTLKNAIASNQLAQAYLFCGPRGVGKTTCARIFAKAINQTEQTDEDTDFSFNIFELDAASNNSVDDIRNLIDQVRVPPQTGKYKVYIIDEVHMLSQAAFNAFLKTLEEPPAHAIFILATTEKHKIIPTILSRCQIFDFNRILVKDIVAHLQKIAEKEKVQAEPDALHIIAEKADGALRDALSIFDQVVSFSGGELTYDKVIANLNVLDYDYYFQLTEHCQKRSIPGSLLVLNEILSNGFDGHHFIVGFAEHLRNLLVCKDDATSELLEVGEQIREKYKAQSQSCDQKWLLQGLEILNNADVQYKSSKNQRLLIEITLMQLCSIGAGAQKKKSKYPIIDPKEVLEDAANSGSSNPPAAKNGRIDTRDEKEVSPASGNASAAPSPSKVKETATNPEPSSKPARIKKKKKKRIKTGVSIAGILTQEEEKKEEKEEQGAHLADLPRDPFTIESFNLAWNAFANEIKSSGNNNLFITLQKSKPNISENVLEMTVNNRVQEHDIHEIKADLLAFLRKRLNNFGIDLQINIAEKKGQNKPYTPMDKFKKLAEKNPALLKLRERFDLDVDY